ncbi:alpha/beta fold hydrolase [Streptomyces sp. WMMB 322]|uniref:alpha/beta fold hydrolase n=1 Tax=Streptomyces sp. WMMB 322 TaxID=1286821 RepID=UPI000823E601|nr:alpha/beta fold hydrolase [Streptomyces sp. WMMB 322]SCK38574.1 Alpha/beta hydrolase family protein [Streptomyces sp. WMMB 322]
MKSLAKKLTSTFLGPVPVSRGRALAISERLTAVTSLTSSLEYITHQRQIRKGGLNDWTIARGMHASSTRPTRRILDAVGNPGTTRALHVARIAASAALLAPGNARWRGAANIFLGLSNAALYPRHRYGTDGSDQVSSFVQTAAGLARLSTQPAVQDALLWYVALQANLSYLVSGWVKLLGQPWRDGSALNGIMRTRTYGHEGMWNLTNRYPVPARYLAHGVLALECLFPVAYLKGGMLARPVMASAAAFHVANGYFMGLGRFITAFEAMHPMVAYTSTPRSHPAVAGRDDRMLKATASMAAIGVTVAGFLAAMRRMRATDPWPHGRVLTTRHGNELHYNERISEDDSSPVLVFGTGMISTMEHFGWITDKLVEESDYGIITYSRAGYGPSKRRCAGPFTLQESVDDLVDLVEGAVAKGRPVYLVGHSLGGEIGRRAAAELGDRIRGVIYLDSSHPDELSRSKQQKESAERLKEGLSMFSGSLRAGLGATLVRPRWVHDLPTEVRSRAFAQYADSRMWRAGLREWDATEADFHRFSGDLPPISSHALVLSAQRTVDRDPEQLLMHNELGAAHRGEGRIVRNSVIEAAEHDTMLTDARLGGEVGRRILEFLREVEGDDADGGRAGGRHSSNGNQSKEAR